MRAGNGDFAAGTPRQRGLAARIPSRQCPRALALGLPRAQPGSDHHPDHGRRCPCPWRQARQELRQHAIAEGRPVSCRQAYLRFDLTGLNNVTRAILRLYAKNGATRFGIRVRAVGHAGWDERTITFAKRPPVGTVVRSARRYRRGRWLSIDVTAAVGGGSTVSFALTSSSSDGLVLTSRESTKKPQLVVTSQPIPPEFAVPPTPAFPPPTTRPVRHSPATPPPPPAPQPPPPAPDPPPPAPDPPPPPPPDPPPPPPDPSAASTPASGRRAARLSDPGRLLLPVVSRGLDPERHQSVHAVPALARLLRVR